MTLFIEGSGRVPRGMGSGLKYGRMGLGMRGSGPETKQMARASSGMWMGMCSMGSGKMTRPTATGSTLMSMGLNMKGTGRTIYSMGMGLRLGLMDHVTMDIIKKGGNMGRGATSGAMGLDTWGTGLRTK